MKILIFIFKSPISNNKEKINIAPSPSRNYGNFNLLKVTETYKNKDHEFSNRCFVVQIGRGNPR